MHLSQKSLLIYREMQILILSKISTLSHVHSCIQAKIKEVTIIKVTINT